MSSPKTAKVTLADGVAPQSIAGGGASYLLESGVEVEVPVAVAVGLTDHPLITVTGVPKKAVDEWRAGSPAPDLDEQPSTDPEPDAPTMGDDDAPEV